jgi:hypothetical protein
MQAGIEQRRHKRYGVALPVQVRVKKGEASSGLTTTKDISSGGLYFTVSKDLELGSDFEFEMFLPQQMIAAVCLDCSFLPQKVVQKTNVRIRGFATIVRVDREGTENKVGIAARIQQYRFSRDETSRSQQFGISLQDLSKEKQEIPRMVKGNL